MRIPIKYLKVDFEKYKSARANDRTDATLSSSTRVSVHATFIEEGIRKENAGADPTRVSQIAARILEECQSIREAWTRPADPPSVRATLDELASLEQWRRYCQKKVDDPNDAVTKKNAIFLHYEIRDIQLYLSWLEWSLADQRARHAESAGRPEQKEIRVPEDGAAKDSDAGEIDRTLEGTDARADAAARGDAASRDFATPTLAAEVVR